MKGMLFTDGASSGNPGEAGIGVILTTKDRRVEISEYIGNTTNNVAEYMALIRGLEKAKKLGIEKVDIFLDSELLVKQINGEYNVKNESLRSLYGKAISLLKSFCSYSIKHIPREKNAEADKLAKSAIKKHRSKIRG